MNPRTTTTAVILIVGVIALAVYLLLRPRDYLDAGYDGVPWKFRITADPHVDADRLTVRLRSEEFERTLRRALRRCPGYAEELDFTRTVFTVRKLNQNEIEVEAELPVYRRFQKLAGELRTQVLPLDVDTCQWNYYVFRVVQALLRRECPNTIP